MTEASEKSYQRYACTACGVAGMKLWRELGSSCVELTCLACSLKETGQAKIGCHSDQIGGKGPAIPDTLPIADFSFATEPAYYGYSSVPDWGIKWWHDLGPELPMGHPEKTRKLETREETEARKIKERQAIADEQQGLIDNTFYVLQMDSFDFWKRWHHIVPLKQHSLGMYQTLDWLDNRPIGVSVFWYTVNEQKLVAFVEDTSALVDHTMIGKWLKETFKNVKPDHFRAPSHQAEFDCMEAIAPGYQKSIRYNLVQKVRDEAERKLDLLPKPNKIT